jgi:hypothetical protein
MNAGVFDIAERAKPFAKEQKVHERVSATASGWSQEAFARQQIQNLVRQVFSSAEPAVRHVVFSEVEMDTDVSEVCWSVGQTLAGEKSGDVLVAVSSEAEAVEFETNWANDLKSHAQRVSRSLWCLSVPHMDRRSVMNAEGLRSFMTEVRREFEYSVIGDSVGGWSGRTTLAGSADGMVLVLSALRTRRASARKLLEELSHARLLGTVLKDREFPIPEGIYHRL